MKSQNEFISTVVPVYGCSEALNELCERLIQSLSRITKQFEVVLVNDACPQNSWDRIQSICLKHKQIKGINLSRNYGQHQAITAGLDHAKGDAVVVMDCDLQDQPEEIIKLYQYMQNGYDVVFGRRVHRSDSFLKRISSSLFYKFYNYFTESEFDGTIANFSIAKRKVIDSVCRMREQSRSYPLLLNWTGFNIGYVDIEHADRKHGKTSYTVTRLLNFALDCIISQSNKPLRLSIQLGFIISIASFILGLYFLLKKLLYGIPIQGWASIIVTLFFVTGLIMMNLGVVAVYIGRIYNETKRRPLYIIKDKIGLDDREGFR